MKRKLIFKQEIDLTTSYKEDIFTVLGIDKYSTQKLLDLLKEGFFKVNDAMKDRLYERDMDAYMDLGTQYSPVACCLYERLHAEKGEPRLPAHLCVNLYQSSGHEPNTIPFWADPDAIRVFYEALKEDGHYDKKAL